jgi:hypothetical protein
MLTEDSIQSQGGLARAEALSPEQRKQIAKKAAEARWASPGATHIGEFKIGNATIRCAVLEDGTRVLTQYDVLEAIGRSGKPAAGRGSADFDPLEKGSPLFDSENLKPFVSNELSASTKPVQFRLPTGQRAWGYRAEILPQICDVYLRARAEGNVLRKPQYKFAAACEILVRGLAHVGIIALVDEATGYQKDRAKEALAEILERFISKELQAWTRTFPVEFYEHIFRLHGWPFDPKRVKRPSVIGHYTNNLIYKRLAPGVLEQLRQKNPIVDGRRKHTHFQWLTGDIGHPKLRSHLDGVLALMRVSDTWDEFTKLVKKAYPIIETTELGMEIELKEK